MTANPEAVKTVDSDGRLPLHVGLLDGADADALSAVVAAFPDAASVPMRPKERGGVADAEYPLITALRSKAAAPVLLKILEAYPTAAEKRISDSYYSLHDEFALHVGLENNAPADALLAILAAYPEAAREVISRRSKQLPLHLAMKHNAHVSVIAAILQAHPRAAITQDDYGQLPVNIGRSSNATKEALAVVKVSAVIPELLISGDVDESLNLPVLRQAFQIDDLSSAPTPDELSSMLQHIRVMVQKMERDVDFQNGVDLLEKSITDITSSFFDADHCGNLRLHNALFQKSSASEVDAILAVNPKAASECVAPSLFVNIDVGVNILLIATLYSLL